MHIRPEQPNDHDSIREILIAAFADHPHSQHTEQLIVAALRAANALTVSMVAIDGTEIIGHIACSPVSVNTEPSKWFGLGPVAVRPDLQGNGIGAALVRASIDQLKASNAEGCVLLGEPGYYQRFGFRAQPQFKLFGVPESHFLYLPFIALLPTGVVTYHAAFAAT